MCICSMHTGTNMNMLQHEGDQNDEFIHALAQQNKAYTHHSRDIRNKKITQHFEQKNLK